MVLCTYSDPKKYVDIKITLCHIFIITKLQNIKTSESKDLKHNDALLLKLFSLF